MQRIEFHPDGDGCKLIISLDYTLKMDPPQRQVIDLFARRPMRDSLKRTLQRFQHELEAGDALA